MAHLSEIKDFIQTVTEAITHSLEIESTVVDDKLTRIAGTVKGLKAVSNGIMKKTIDTGQHHIVEDPRKSSNCRECNLKHECTETANLNCPIFLNGKVIGVMSLICKDDNQKKSLIDKKDSLLSFIQCMCELISSRLKEHAMLENIETHNTMLNQILNTVSDGYIIVNNQNFITNINKFALSIIGMTHEKAINRLVNEIIPDLDIKSVMYSKEYTSYDEVSINGKTYGLFVTAMKEGNKAVGAVISFKNVDKISSRVYSKAFQDKRIKIDDIIGKSKAIMDTKALVKKTSVNDVNILLFGESGTGKDLFARAIHNSSERCNNPFISMNCAAIPRDLLESELFGYEPGAFTGANKTGKLGKFELADRGTIFLDEIGDMPFYLQSKLLKVLQDRTIERVGGIEQKHVDVRIIAATNKNLEVMVREGKFREDLYYRINVIPIHVPPLRKRHGDVELLTQHFLEKYTSRFGILNKSVSAKAMEILITYNWPGNVRQLENLVQYLVSVCSGAVIDIDILPKKLFARNNQTDHVGQALLEVVPLAIMEKEIILNALKIYGVSTEGKLKAAEVLGISKTTLYRKLAEYRVK